MRKYVRILHLKGVERGGYDRFYNWPFCLLTVFFSTFFIQDTKAEFNLPLPGHNVDKPSLVRRSLVAVVNHNMTRTPIGHQQVKNCLYIVMVSFYNNSCSGISWLVFFRAVRKS